MIPELRRRGRETAANQVSEHYLGKLMNTGQRRLDGKAEDALGEFVMGATI